MINVERGSKNVPSRKGNNPKLAGNYDQGARVPNIATSITPNGQY